MNMDLTELQRMFNYVVTRQLDMEVIMDLDTIAEINEKPENTYQFQRKIMEALQNSSKLFGISPKMMTGQYGNQDDIFYSVLFNAFVNSYDPDIPGFFDVQKIIDELQPRDFETSANFPFVGGSRQGELDGFFYKDIENVFGPPNYDQGSGDGKVQLEWEIKFDNGVRATIYDYKQYDYDAYNEVDYWSVGGNSASSAAEVYKAMGLIKFLD